MSHRAAIFSALLLVAVPCRAQSSNAPAVPEPPLRRWIDVQNVTIYTRYRFIESNADVVSSNDLQYKETVRLRVNADARKRYSLNVGIFSGTNFIGSWDNTGVGISQADYHSHYIKQLFGSAAPLRGLELQGGGLYVIRGETTEFSSYDDDGYLVGERVSVRRPAQLYLDEISVTQGTIGPAAAPNLFDRWDGFKHQKYTQLLAAKRFSPTIAASVDYTNQTGAETLRAAMSLRFKPTAHLTALRFEQYRRVDPNPAFGFVITAERPITKWVRLQGGYATIDERYGNLNADRIQRGRRVFAIANVPIHGPLSGALYATQALQSSYSVSNRTRFDAILQYDLLATLRKTGKI